MPFDIYSLSATERECVFEACQEYLSHSFERGKKLTEPADTKAFLQLYFRTTSQEIFGCIFLTTRHRILGVRDMFYGTIDGSAVYPREVVRAVIDHNASAVILYHNHPSGDPSPSAADKDITRRLKDALSLIDVRILDHLIIGQGHSVSMAEQGLI